MNPEQLHVMLEGRKSFRDDEATPDRLLGTRVDACERQSQNHCSGSYY